MTFDDLRSNIEIDIRKLSLPHGRRVGQPGHDVARQYLVGRMHELGLQPFRGESFDLRYERSVAFHAEPTSFTNLVGVIRGRNSSLDPILIGAHYDSVIDAPCSDDNAAAVAISLAAADVLRSEPLERDVIIALFDAEEPPFFHSEAMGSTRFYEDHCDEVRFAAVLIMDLVGHDVEAGDGEVARLAPDLANWIFVMGAESHAALSGVVRRATASKRDLTVVATLNDYVGDMSDHHAFRLGGEPFLFLSCGQGKYYHDQRDTPDWVNFDKTFRVFELIVELAREIDLDGMTRGGAADTTAFEIETLEAAIGEPLPLLLQAAGLERLATRADVDRLVGAVRSFLLV